MSEDVAFPSRFHAALLAAVWVVHRHARTPAPELESMIAPLAAMAVKAVVGTRILAAVVVVVVKRH